MKSNYDAREIESSLALVAVIGPNFDRISKAVLLSGILIATFLRPAVIMSDIVVFFFNINPVPHNWNELFLRKARVQVLFFEAMYEIDP